MVTEVNIPASLLTSSAMKQFCPSLYIAHFTLNETMHDLEKVTFLPPSALAMHFRGIYPAQIVEERFTSLYGNCHSPPCTPRKKADIRSALLAAPIT